MNKILDIATKDLRQILRDRKLFLFLLIMPVAFTLLFGFAFGGVGQQDQDNRLPAGILYEDEDTYSVVVSQSLKESEVIRLEDVSSKALTDLEKEVREGDLAGVIIIPVGYSDSLRKGSPLALQVIADLAAPAGTSVQGEALRVASLLSNAATSALVVSQTRGSDFDETMSAALAAWEKPPIKMISSATAVAEQPVVENLSMAHSSPGMMLQFAIAGLLTSATIIVNERKTRALQRLLTTATSRWQILLGHYLAIFTMVLLQFALLILFGQLILRVNYFREPGALLLIMLASTACIAALGLLIGVLAKSEEQAIIFSLIPMFIFAALGGAWTPLEYTSPTFQTIGHLTPLAWSLDGFKNIIVRGFGIEAAWLPALVLTGYACLFFMLAIWFFRKATR